MNCDLGGAYFDVDDPQLMFELLWERKRNMHERGLTKPAAYLVIVASKTEQSTPASVSLKRFHLPDQSRFQYRLRQSARHKLSSNIHPSPPSHLHIKQKRNRPLERPSSTSNQTPQNSQAASNTITQTTPQSTQSTMQPSVIIAPSFEFT